MRKNILKEQDFVNFEFYIAKSEPTHLHQTIELLYILEGNVEVVVEENQYSAKSEDIIVINTNKKHSYQAEGDVLLACFEIDFLRLCKSLNSNELLFWCNSVVNQNTAYQELRNIMKRIFNQYYSKNDMSMLILESDYYQLLRILAEHFQVGGGYVDFPKDKGTTEKRQEQIANYISSNYKMRISLTEMAKYLYVSVPYLSKYIKKQFGMNFSEYVNEVRLINAVDDLLYTERTIMSIALDNGFANTTTFNELFKKRYGSTPSIYRKRMLKEMHLLPVQEIEGNKREKERRVDEYLKRKNKEIPEEKEEKNRNQRIDTKVRKEYVKHWNYMINVGRASDLLRSDMQEHILMMKEDLGFASMRIWDFFSPELMINESDNEGRYNFEKADRILDFLVEHDIIPYIELGYKPKNIHKTLHDRLVAEERVNGFKQITGTKQFFGSFIRHLVNRYGIEEVEKWHFEQWKGEDFVNDYGNEQFFEVFESLYHVIKAVSPKTKVGGGGIGIQYGNGNLTKLVKEWSDRKYHPDFLSLYCYPYVRGDEDGVAYAKLSADREFLKNQLLMARQVIQMSELRNVEVHVSEWSSTISNRNILNDSCYKGAYIMKNILSSLGLAEVLGYWVGSDIFAEYYDNSSVLFGGCGLLSKQGIKKPAYYAYSFVNNMHKYLIKKDENYIITTDNHNNYFMACHNYQPLNYKYYLKQENEQDINQLAQLYESDQIINQYFYLDNVKDGNYKIKIYSVTDAHGSVQEEWRNMGFSGPLSKQEVNYLKRVCTPRIQIKECSAENKKLEFDIEMSPQEIQYIYISYVYK